MYFQYAFAASSCLQTVWMEKLSGIIKQSEQFNRWDSTLPNRDTDVRGYDSGSTFG